MRRKTRRRVGSILPIRKLAPQGVKMIGFSKYFTGLNITHIPNRKMLTCFPKGNYGVDSGAQSHTFIPDF